MTWFVTVKKRFETREEAEAFAESVEGPETFWEIEKETQEED